MKSIRLITLAPGHFHAALIQKRMTLGVNRRGFVYGPLDRDTAAHVERLAAYNARRDDATEWEVDLRASPDWLERFHREQPGNTVVLSGRNRTKIDLMQQAIANGLHVLADKPWIVEWSDFPKLEEALRDAELREVLTWDMLTERFQITNLLQRELIRDAEIFGRWQTGTPEQPALVLESLHFLKKEVAGQPLLRPWWWFDPAISGEAMADVGTHLADLALWLIYLDNAIDYQKDIQLLDADRWPLVLSEKQFKEVTGLPRYIPELVLRLVNGQLYYAGNNTVTLTLNGVHVKLAALWEYESAEGGGDTHNSTARGTRGIISIRQPAGTPPEVFASALDPADHAAYFQRLEAKCTALQWRFPGLGIVDHGTEAQFTIPDTLRTTHESHFAAVMEEYVRYFNTPRAAPPWERPNSLARYYITTQAVELARQKRPGR